MHLVSAATTTRYRSTPTRACAMRTTSPTSSSSAAWQEWPCSMENCWTVSRYNPSSCRAHVSKLFVAQANAAVLQGFSSDLSTKWCWGSRSPSKTWSPWYDLNVTRLASCCKNLGVRTFLSWIRGFKLLILRCFPRTVNTTTLSNGSWRMTPPSWTWGSV